MVASWRPSIIIGEATGPLAADPSDSVVRLGRAGADRVRYPRVHRIAPSAGR